MGSFKGEVNQSDILLLNRSRHSAVLPAVEGAEVHPLCQRPAPRPETCKHFHQHRPTAPQDWRFRISQNS